LLAWSQTLIPHVAVLATRAHAELAARVADEDDRTERVEVDHERTPHLTRSAPGGWSQPRYQHRAEVQWERNATDVAEVLAKMVDRVRPRFIAAAGDVRALQLLREQSPKRVRELIEVVGGEFASIDRVLEEAEKLASAAAEADTTALLDEFEQERGQHDRAADGAEATFDALTRHQVRVLLVRDDPDDTRSAWFGEEPAQVALDREVLIAQGEPTPVEGRLLDVAVRAALGSGADVRVLGPETDGRGPGDGLGGVLRYSV
jgi:peptide subunit release factor 1 (eRF1)